MIAPFVSLEGSYTWNGIKDSTINGTKSTLTTDGWCGRAGVMLESVRNNALLNLSLIHQGGTTSDFNPKTNKTFISTAGQIMDSGVV